MAKKDLISLADRTTEEQQEIARKGGIASGKARRQKRLLRECLDELLNSTQKTRDGREITGAEAICIKLFEKALKGDRKAFETIRSTVGQDPVHKIQTTEIDPEVRSKVEAIVNDKRASHKSSD